MSASSPPQALELAPRDHAVRELLALVDRQREWMARLDGQRDPSSTIELLARGMEATRERWVGSVRTLSHDLRSPLTVIKTNVGFLRDSGSFADDETVEVLDDIYLGIQRVEELLTAITSVATFDLAHVEVETECVAVSQLAESVARRAAALRSDKPIEVSIQIAPGTPSEIDADRLILDRSLDAVLAHVAAHLDSGRLQIELAGNDELLTFEITDTGPGVDGDELARVFETATLRRPQPGGRPWGQSLMAAARLLERVGGQIEIASSVDQGTTVWVHIPRQMHCSPSPSPGGASVVVRSR
ncbi:MAG: HAMP domain-containing histidine kinase [Polyangiaceae bacterium]|nr:HAMP domain-containing histidine kinase [Polyangiaceae bacterium]